MLKTLLTITVSLIPTFVFAIDDNCSDEAAHLAPHKHLYVDAAYDTARKSENPAAAKTWRDSIENFDKDPKAETLKLARLINESVNSDTYPGHKVYRDAVLLLAKNPEHLVGRVRVYLPGGLDGNKDDFWKPVKAATIELCSCGNERAIDPVRSLIAEKYIPANPPTPVVVDLKNSVYINQPVVTYPQRL